MRNRVEPVEEAVESDNIVSRGIHTNGKDGGPSKKRRSGEWDVCEEKSTSHKAFIFIVVEVQNSTRFKPSFVLKQNAPG